MVKKVKVKSKSKLGLLIGILILSIGLLVSVELVQKNQENRSKATYGGGFMEGSYSCREDGTVYYCTGKPIQGGKRCGKEVTVIDCNSNKNKWSSRFNVCKINTTGETIKDKLGDTYLKFQALCTTGGQIGKTLARFSTKCDSNKFNTDTGECLPATCDNQGGSCVQSGPGMKSGLKCRVANNANGITNVSLSCGGIVSKVCCMPL